MSSVSVFLRTDKVNKKGLAPLYLQIISNRKKKYISLGQYVSPKNWDKEKGTVKRGEPNYQWLNNYLAHQISEANKKLLNVSQSSGTDSLLKIRNHIKGGSSEDFIAYANEILESFLNREKYGTYRSYKVIVKKLVAFYRKPTIPFHEINIPFLKSFEQHLRKKYDNKTNTVHRNLKALRRIMNSAVRDEIITIEQNPFFKFKLTTEPTTKVYLKEEELARIENLELEDSNRLGLHRDLFVFACYAGGLRLSDILQLKWENYDGKCLGIIINKTKQMHVIPLPKKAIAIIEKFRSTSAEQGDFIFPVLMNKEYTGKEYYNAILNAGTRINKSLKQIAIKTKIPLKGFSFHSSRHTFATIGLRKGIRMEHISKLLGHTDIRTTQVYAKIVNQDLEEAMKVFDE